MSLVCHLVIFQGTGVPIGILLERSWHRKGIALVLSILSLGMMSHRPNINEGIVTQTHAHALIVSKSYFSVRVLTDAPARIGDRVSFTIQKRKPSTESYDKMKRITETITVSALKVIPQNSILQSLRRYFHDEGWLHDLGLQLATLIFLLETFCGALSQKFRKGILFTCFLCYGYVFGVTFALVRLFLKQCRLSTPTIICILLILFPMSFQTLSFLFPFGYYCAKFLFPKLRKWHFYAGLHLFFRGVFNPVEMYLYPMNRFLNLLPNKPVISFPAIAFVGTIPLVGHLVLIMLYKHPKRQWLLFISMMFVNAYPPWMRITAVDVGQGDATVIQYPLNLKTILIDTGRASSWHHLKTTLYKLGITRIDDLVITHYDLDHYESMSDVISTFHVQRVIDEKGMAFEPMTVHLKDKVYQDDNGNSIILSARYFNVGFLFMGDAGVIQESELEAVKVDVLKCGHHGSKTSTSLDFLRKVQPKYCIISSDPSKYGHPHREVMRHLYQAGVIPLETSKLGDIQFFLFPNFGFIYPSKGGFAIMYTGDTHD